MCNLVLENICSITKNICPYMYFCNKTKSWKPLKSMPAICKIKKEQDIPNGYYKVCFERHNNLYINIDGNIQIIPNPFNDVPLYVKAIKLKNGKWRLKKYEG